MFPFFGINLIRARLKLSERFLLRKQRFAYLNKGTRNRCQKCLIKGFVRPSGPGADFILASLIDLSSSLNVSSLSREIFSPSVNLELTLTLPSSIYYTSPPSLSTRNLPPPYLVFFIEFFRAVVTIYPPAGKLEPAPGGRGAVVRELHVLSQFFYTMLDKQQNPITTC